MPLVKIPKFKAITKNTITIYFVFHYRGAGQEVGRSCIMLEFKGKIIMVCIHITYVFKLVDCT